VIKRVFDILFSSAGLLVLSPVILFIYLVVVYDSKGGGFYRQNRVGKDNKDFRLLKFRTMRTDADKSGLITIGGKDPRITRAGYWLRKYKLDEIPQLINVLVGDMSLVGPRPEVRKYVDLYTPREQQILTVRPGITDWASIEYSDENELLAGQEFPDKFYVSTIMPNKLNLNLKYIFVDIKIIFLTLRKIVIGK
jgi:lipopolysaccharide/colanic/teichoic acid biosynthesis glycosyltransferase